MTSLPELLEASAAMHRHLCPRQVLGVRMGLLAGAALRLDVPQSGKRLLAIVETDGCFTDGVAVASNCWVGRRTMRVEDCGKVAGTFVDTASGRAVRIAPRPEARVLAWEHAPEAPSRWEAMLLGYQRMPVECLFVVREVSLRVPVEALLGRGGQRIICAACGEEVINGREVLRDGLSLCRRCAFGGYWRPADPPQALVWLTSAQTVDAG